MNHPYSNFYGAPVTRVVNSKLIKINLFSMDISFSDFVLSVYSFLVILEISLTQN